MKYYPEGNTPQNSSCAATFHPSQKLSKLDEPDMRYTPVDPFTWTSKGKTTS